MILHAEAFELLDGHGSFWYPNSSAIQIRDIRCSDNQGSTVFTCSSPSISYVFDVIGCRSHDQAICTSE